MSYNVFADYYDDLMQNVGYSQRCDYIVEIMKKHKHEFGITLDLACGTGSLTRELAKKGVDVYGIDASAEMLSEAMQKSADENLNILYLKQNMQSLNLYGTIDTCVCTLDSINHITNIDDVQKAFDKVAFFMNENGFFVFDVNTTYKHNKILANNTFVYETEKVFCVWQNTLCDDNLVEIDLDFFEEENGVYFRTSESFSERAYSDEEIRKMLVKAGFTVENVYGDMTFEQPKEDEQRLVYVARLKKAINKYADK